MSTIKSSAENLTLNADGANNDIKFQSNGSEVASIDQAGVLVSAGGSTHADNVKAKFGTGNDMEIYHNGTQSYIENASANLLIMTGGGAVNLQKGSSEYLARFHSDGAAELYHNNVKMLETSTTGIKVGFANNGFITSTYAVVLETTGGEPVVIRTAGAERVKVLASGRCAFNNGVVLGAGVADTAANTLDDYEEGTFEANLHSAAGSLSLGNNKCCYTKVGRTVTVNGRVDVSSVSSPSGELRILNLPFTSANLGESSGEAAVSLFIYNFTSGASGNWVGWIAQNSTMVYMRYGSGITPSGTAANLMKAGTEVRWAATYTAST